MRSENEMNNLILEVAKNDVRINLTVQSINYALQHIKKHKLCKILMDKKYLAACNEFW